MCCEEWQLQQLAMLVKSSNIRERSIALNMIKIKKQRIINGKTLIVTVDMGKGRYFGSAKLPAIPENMESICICRSS
jgi:hypothetical protein